VRVYLWRFREGFAERGLHCRVARKDGEGYHYISIVSTMCKPKMIARRIIKKLVVVDIAQELGETY
jgi:hypothetical protein